MKKTKSVKAFTLAAITLALTACGNLSDVSKEGTTDNPVFPKIEKSVFNHDGSQFGSWVNWDNVRQIEKGMNKDQLYNLIGRPHFAEGLYGVHEWDYVFNYRENGVHKICQYKVLFDNNMNVNQQWWLPNGCGGLAPYQLNADTLFDFDKATLTAEGKKVIGNLAAELKANNAQNIHAVGYTDRLGSAEYNIDLSQRRANAVKAELIENGVKAPITTDGRGKADQVKACDGMSGQAEKDCLRPNRRVIVTADGTKAVMENTKAAGHDGPVKVRQYQQDAQKTSWSK